MDSLLPFLQGTCTPYNMPVYPGARCIVGQPEVSPSVSNTSVNILDRRSPLYLLIIYLKDPNGTGGGSKQYNGWQQSTVSSTRCMIIFHRTFPNGECHARTLLCQTFNHRPNP